MVRGARGAVESFHSRSQYLNRLYQLCVSLLAAEEPSKKKFQVTNQKRLKNVESIRTVTVGHYEACGSRAKEALRFKARWRNLSESTPVLVKKLSKMRIGTPGIRSQSELSTSNRGAKKRE